MADAASASVGAGILSTNAAILIGILGGFVGEFVKWYHQREMLFKNWPAYAKSASYWVLTGLMILMGGGLVFLHILNGTSLGVFIAFNVGLTAPLVLSEAKNFLPRIEPGSSD